MVAYGVLSGAFVLCVSAALDISVYIEIASRTVVHMSAPVGRGAVPDGRLGLA